jgi:succinate dehydrogenase / fumarate reductase iron-sulfur subunit
MRIIMGATMLIVALQAHATLVTRDWVNDGDGLITLDTNTGLEWLAFDAATCIGCGACVAQCPNGAAQLFTSAKVGHLNILPQGAPEKDQRAVAMVERMEAELFGSCSNFRECEAVCPKGISIKYISRMNRDFLKAQAQALTSLKGQVKAQ